MHAWGSQRTFLWFDMPAINVPGEKFGAPFLN
ncbi:hypothetical protein SAMN05443144_1037 [Fodinibius roseus]|uniref:Uncharacterized protein n=1 Tax=Fodinibius roseus TaxID=1194090 RepID=A0A1M4VQ21_9BACT|nr:hypothetical protein SAMN05443144_1037 [Fodinibius roseus]